MFGRVWTDEEKEKHRKDCLGNNKGKKPSRWQIEYLRFLHLGTKASEETRKKRSLSMLARREKHWNWKGGVWNKNNQVRKSLEMKVWREAVFKRDDWTCQECKRRGVYLEAHHVKKFSEYPELRFELNNGMTLCRDCHDLTKHKKVAA